MRKTAPAKAPTHAAMTVPMEMLSWSLEVEEPAETVGDAAEEEEDVVDARTVLTMNGSMSVAESAVPEALAIARPVLVVTSARVTPALLIPATVGAANVPVSARRRPWRGIIWATMIRKGRCWR